MIHAHFNMKLSHGTSSAVPEMSLNIDGKESFHEYWKLLLHYAFISPHWGGREIKLLISNFINSLIYSESHIKQNFSLKYLNIPSRLCARYFSEAQEDEGIRCSLISNGNEWDLLCPACRACPLLENTTPCQVLSTFFFLQPLQRLWGFLDLAWLMAQKTPSWEFTEIRASKTLNCLLVREQRKLKQQKVHQIVLCKLEPKEVQFRKHLPACLDLRNAGVNHSTRDWKVLFNYHDMIREFFYSSWVCVLGYEAHRLD